MTLGSISFSITSLIQNSKAMQFVQRLKVIRQDDYFHIEEYHHEIAQLVKKLSTAKRRGKAETQNRLEEAFLSGLNQTTEIEMMK
ncbi:hypothetical protein HZS_3187, partial [Henneguya salminicola]